MSPRSGIPFFRAAWWLSRWHRRLWPLALAVLLLYLLYLPFSGYRFLPFDAEVYWNIAAYFHKGGSTSLLHYDNGLRGYLLPLLFYPLHAIHYFTGIAPLVFGRLQGALSAALGFGLLGPGLWQAATGQLQPPSWRRRALFAGLGFVFWGDHFNFTLSDFPALWALLGGLWLLYRPQRLRWALLAGACLAAAVNIRPVYLAAAPVFVAVLLAVPTTDGQPTRLRRLLLLALGAALVLGPQLLINRHHFGRNTPLVLAQDQNVAPGTMYLGKLWFGIAHQKYESAIASDYPEPIMFYLDAEGQELLRTEQPRWFTSEAEYLRLAARHPLQFARQYALHLFNGLDVQYPTPYVPRVYASSLLRALLNYTVWFGAGLVLLGAPWRRFRPHHWLLLAALLLPCAAVLPVSMECRFLLPLHLLLYAALCFGWPAAWRPWAQPKSRLLLLGAAYVVFVAVCLSVSASAQASLEKGGRTLTGRRLPPHDDTLHPAP